MYNCIYRIFDECQDFVYNKIKLKSNLISRIFYTNSTCLPDLCIMNPIRAIVILKSVKENVRPRELYSP